MRADAQRNYDRIVEVARQMFRKDGYDVSLDEIAKRAEVGPGTLYRHFPNRETLLNAVMQSWVDLIQGSADKALASELPPRELLVSWFEDFVTQITLHRGGAARITAAMGREDSPIAHKCQVLVNANKRVLDQLAGEGALPATVDPIQVCRLVGGVASVADQAELDPAAVRPMLEVIADGLLVRP
ncbi:MAG: transcriptional regulator, TetR family [Marmoricola sp.]|jgi:AcrR family transcriptional regulator|nr:transcriptional regulator, TetR family [Marmoricola sp.]